MAHRSPVESSAYTPLKALLFFVVLELKFATERKQTKRHTAKVKTGKKAESRDSREELKLCNLFLFTSFRRHQPPTYLPRWCKSVWSDFNVRVIMLFHDQVFLSYFSFLFCVSFSPSGRHIWRDAKRNDSSPYKAGNAKPTLQKNNWGNEWRMKESCRRNFLSACPDISPNYKSGPAPI